MELTSTSIRIKEVSQNRPREAAALFSKGLDLLFQGQFDGKGAVALSRLIRHFSHAARREGALDGWERPTDEKARLVAQATLDATKAVKEGDRTGLIEGIASRLPKELARTLFARGPYPWFPHCDKAESRLLQSLLPLKESWNGVETERLLAVTKRLVRAEDREALREIAPLLLRAAVEHASVDYDGKPPVDLLEAMATRHVWQTKQLVALASMPAVDCPELIRQIAALPNKRRQLGLWIKAVDDARRWGGRPTISCLPKGEIPGETARFLLDHAKLEDHHRLRLMRGIDLTEADRPHLLRMRGHQHLPLLFQLAAKKGDLTLYRTAMQKGLPGKLTRRLLLDLVDAQSLAFHTLFHQTSDRTVRSELLDLQVAFVRRFERKREIKRQMQEIASTAVKGRETIRTAEVWMSLIECGDAKLVDHYLKIRTDLISLLKESNRTPRSEVISIFGKWWRLLAEKGDQTQLLQLSQSIVDTLTMAESHGEEWFEALECAQTQVLQRLESAEGKEREALIETYYQLLQTIYPKNSEVALSRFVHLWKIAAKEGNAETLYRIIPQSLHFLVSSKIGEQIAKEAIDPLQEVCQIIVDREELAIDRAILPLSLFRHLPTDGSERFTTMIITQLLRKAIEDHTLWLPLLEWHNHVRAVLERRGTHLIGKQIFELITPLICSGEHPILLQQALFHLAVGTWTESPDEICQKLLQSAKTPEVCHQILGYQIYFDWKTLITSRREGVREATTNYLRYTQKPDPRWAPKEGPARAIWTAAISAWAVTEPIKLRCEADRLGKDGKKEEMLTIYKGVQSLFTNLDQLRAAKLIDPRSKRHFLDALASACYHLFATTTRPDNAIRQGSGIFGLIVRDEEPHTYPSLFALGGVLHRSLGAHYDRSIQTSNATITNQLLAASIWEKIGDAKLYQNCPQIRIDHIASMLIETTRYREPIRGVKLATNILVQTADSFSSDDFGEVVSIWLHQFTRQEGGALAAAHLAQLLASPIGEKMRPWQLYHLLRLLERRAEPPPAAASSSSS